MSNLGDESPESTAAIGASAAAEAAVGVRETLEFLRRRFASGGDGGTGELMGVSFGFYTIIETVTNKSKS